jgi:membrane protein implicated in regulation of membrane protease activity
MVWIWLGVVISLLLTEYLSRNFTAICFFISGIISGILTEFTNNYMIQLGEFLIVGILLITFVRPFLLKCLKSKKKDTVQEKNKNKGKRKENKYKK